MDRPSCGRKTGMPHAILIPFPAQGHINPMMQLASKLASDGFLITFVLTDFSHHRIMQANNKKGDFHDSCDMIRIVSIPDGLPADDSRKDLVKLKRAVENSMGPSAVSKLIQDINAKEEIHKLTCLIVDVSLCISLHEVAQMHHISLAALCTSPASNFALRYFSSRLVSLGMLNSDGTPKQHKMVKYLLSLPALNPGELPWLYGGAYRFQQGIRVAEAIRNIKWLLFNSFYEQEAPVLDELSTELAAYPIGPMVAETTTTKVLPSIFQAEVKCLEWLDKQGEKSVIYVSFGSLAVWKKRQVQEFAMGLEATNRPFLWVVRSDLVEGDEPVLSPPFLERIEERGYVVSWAPQLRVLAHPSIACFVTHCGWNSVQESISMGVPMLCCPCFTDQFLNRTYIVDTWKVGLSLNPNHDGLIDQHEFAKAVEKLLVGEEGVAIRKGSMKMKSVAGNAVKKGGSSFNNYNFFVNALKKQLLG